MGIGALVLTYNEEDMIEPCLESIDWVDEIIVVDSYSEDMTVEICRQYTDKIFKREFDNFSNQRNYGLEKLESEWVLILDADERITDKLQKEIIDITSQKKYNNEVYKIPRKSYFLGKWIKHCGWYPDYTVRLFLNRPDHRYQNLVHEKLNFSGEAGKVENPLIHRTYESLGEFAEKMNHYTELAGQEDEGMPIILVFLRPILEFIKKFILQRGFLSGKEGLILSMMLSYYSFLKYAKKWESQNT